MKKIVSILALVGLVLALAVACTTTQDASSKKKDTPLINTRWGLLSLNGKEIDKSKARKEIHIILRLNSNRFEGYAGCNGIGGLYEQSIDGTINFSGIISTMMACEAMEIETQFTQALESATTYKISKDELTLYTNGKEVAKLYAVYLR